MLFPLFPFPLSLLCPHLSFSSSPPHSHSASGKSPAVSSLPTSFLPHSHLACLCPLPSFLFCLSGSYLTAYACAPNYAYHAHFTLPAHLHHSFWTGFLLPFPIVLSIPATVFLILFILFHSYTVNICAPPPGHCHALYASYLYSPKALIYLLYSSSFIIQ